jgi:hypothetical protein
MAKKRKEKDEEKEIDFKIPKFDKEKFIKNERQKIKITFLSFFFGVAIAFISFGFWILLRGNNFRWELVLLFGVFTAAWLKYLLIRLNIDMKELGRRGIFSSYAIYFFTWLLILIVLANPPFYDDEDPIIEVITLPSAQELGGTVKIIARITDNVGIEDIDFNLVYPDGTKYNPTSYSFENNIFSYTYENSDDILGEYYFTLLATDFNGRKSNEQKGNGTFKYSNDTIKLPEPSSANDPSGAEVTYTTDIKFDVKPDISRFYYSINEGEYINATKDGEYYKTSPKIEGWKRGMNVTVKAFADIIYYFDNLGTEFNNTIIDSGTYYFNISDVPEIGTEEQPEIILPKPKFVQIPGFEIIVFVISLIFVLLIFKFRKKEGISN